MREKRETPDPWATWLITAELTVPNIEEPRASLNRLAARTGIHVSTLTAMIFGERKTSEVKLRAVAGALGVDVVTVSAAAGRARTVREPYVAPEQVHSLSREVQDAISDLIRALAKEREDDGREPAAKSEAEETSAQDAANDMVARERAESTDSEAPLRGPHSHTRSGAKRRRNTPHGGGTAESTTL